MTAGDRDMQVRNPENRYRRRRAGRVVTAAAGAAALLAACGGGHHKSAPDVSYGQSGDPVCAGPGVKASETTIAGLWAAEARLVVPIRNLYSRLLAEAATGKLSDYDLSLDETADSLNLSFTVPTELTGPQAAGHTGSYVVILMADRTNGQFAFNDSSAFDGRGDSLSIAAVVSPSSGEQPYMESVQAGIVNPDNGIFHGYPPAPLTQQESYGGKYYCAVNLDNATNYVFTQTATHAWKQRTSVWSGTVGKFEAPGDVGVLTSADVSELETSAAQMLHRVAVRAPIDTTDFSG